MCCENKYVNKMQTFKCKFVILVPYLELTELTQEED
jgi:hypothetical protein